MNGRYGCQAKIVTRIIPHGTSPPPVALSDVLELDMLVDHGIKVSDRSFVTECL